MANTGTTIVTFLMVFIIQNTQNRDAKAIQLKVDEDLAEITREKEIVDQDDPDPPKDKPKNGRTKGAPASR